MCKQHFNSDRSAGAHCGDITWLAMRDLHGAVRMSAIGSALSFTLGYDNDNDNIATQRVKCPQIVTIKKH